MEEVVRRFFFGVLAVCVFVLSSCDDFFSTSLWPATQTYNLANVDVNAGNIDQWVDSARGNPELAAALMDKINQDLASGRFHGEEKAKLMEAGIRLAVNSSGMGSSIISNASNILGNLDSVGDDTLLDLLGGVRSDFNNNGGPAAAENLANIANAGIGSGSPPQFEPDYANTAVPGDVAEAVFVLALGELGPDANVSDWSNPSEMGLDINEDGYFTVIEPNPSPNQRALAAYLNLINSGGPEYDNNPLTSAIRDAFKSTNE